MPPLNGLRALIAKSRVKRNALAAARGKLWAKTLRKATGSTNAQWLLEHPLKTKVLYPDPYCRDWDLTRVYISHAQGVIQSHAETYTDEELLLIYQAVPYIAVAETVLRTRIFATDLLLRYKVEQQRDELDFFALQADLSTRPYGEQVPFFARNRSRRAGTLIVELPREDLHEFYFSLLERIVDHPQSIEGDNLDVDRVEYELKVNGLSFSEFSVRDDECDRLNPLLEDTSGWGVHYALDFLGVSNSHGPLPTAAIEATRQELRRLAEEDEQAMCW